MFITIYLDCPYKEVCSVSIFFGYAYTSFSDKGCEAVGYEYTFVQDSSKEIVWNNVTLENIPFDFDEHIRFSLFDGNDVEKKYDIDLPNIIPSYTLKEDSVEILMPTGMQLMNVRCPFCNGENYDNSRCSGLYMCKYYGIVTEPKMVMIGTDSTWGKYADFSSSFSKQGSMNTDYIDVKGTIYFRE